MMRYVCCACSADSATKVVDLYCEFSRLYH